MPYRVTWCLVEREGNILDNDRFPNVFPSYEEAISFILDHIDQAPCLGYDRIRDFWWIRRTKTAEQETRFWITPAMSSRPQPIDASSAA